MNKNDSNIKFYIIALVVAIIFSMIMMVLAFSFISKPKNDDNESNIVVNPTSTPNNQENNDISNTEASTESFVGLINNITANSISFYDITNEIKITYSPSDDMEIRDKYGQLLTYGELSVGDIVDITYFPDNKEIKTIKESSMAWEGKNISGAKNSKDDNYFLINDTIYNYNENTILLSNDTGINSPEDITSVDSFDMRGYGTDVYYINVLSGHGQLVFNNKEDIVNGMVEIDTSFTKSLSEIGTINVSTGNHNVVVKGENIEPFTELVNIKSNETTFIDLSQVQIKKGLVNLAINVSSPIVKIDDKSVNLNDPIFLPYGDHTISVMKEGYKPYEGEFTLNTEVFNYKIELEKETEKVELTKVKVDSVPEGADVYIDSAYIGKTPCEHSVTYGDHKIFITKDGYVDITLPIVTHEKEQNYRISLQEEDSTITPSENIDDVQTGDADYIYGN